MNPQGICGYRDFCASSECNKCKANRTFHYLSVFRSCCGCPTLLLQKNCQNVYRAHRKWMKSKFLDQDFDVVFLANKGIVIGYFVGRNYDKNSHGDGKALGHHQGHEECFHRMIKSSDTAFTTPQIDFEFDILFLGPLPGILFTCIHDNFKVLVPWKWDRFSVFRMKLFLTSNKVIISGLDCIILTYTVCALIFMTSPLGVAVGPVVYISFIYRFINMCSFDN